MAMAKKWNVFRPDKSRFKSEKDFCDYRNMCTCALCKRELKTGDEFDLRPVQTVEEAGGLTVKSVIVHRKCVEE